MCDIISDFLGWLVSVIFWVALEERVFSFMVSKNTEIEIKEMVPKKTATK
jgi:hypothetical protein